MSERDLRLRVSKSAAKAGIRASAEMITSLVVYLEQLARWNRKINLTALTIDPPNEQALDRLIAEPLSATRFIAPNAKLMLDVGSGGGSPAIPMRIVRPSLRLVMVESKARKSAFLSEVCRQLNLENVAVETCRYEELLSRPELHESVDLVTVRAVRIEPKVLRATLAFLRPHGRVFLFNSRGAVTEIPESLADLRLVQHEALVQGINSYLDVLEKR